MIKKIILLFGIVMVLSSFKGKAQYIFPTMAEDPLWHILICNFGLGYWCYTWQYYYEYETSICDKTYYSLARTHGDDYKWLGFLRIEEERVYVRLSADCSEKEYLMYDFSLSIGDTVYCGFSVPYPAYTGDTVKFRVVDIDTIQLQGVNRKSMVMEYYPDPNSPNWGVAMHWLQGVGTSFKPFFPLECSHFWCEGSINLLCLDSANHNLYINTYHNTCDTTIEQWVGINGVDISEQLTFAPNPFSDHTILQINSKDSIEYELLIYDVRGQLNRTILFSSTGEHIIYRENMKSGMYLFQLLTDNKIISTGKLLVK